MASPDYRHQLEGGRFETVQDFLLLREESLTGLVVKHPTVNFDGPSQRLETGVP